MKLTCFGEQGREYSSILESVLLLREHLEGESPMSVNIDSVSFNVFPSELSDDKL